MDAAWIEAVQKARIACGHPPGYEEWEAACDSCMATLLLAAAQEAERNLELYQIEAADRDKWKSEADRLTAEVARLTQREVELLAVLRVAKDALDSVGVTLRELALRQEA